MLLKKLSSASKALFSLTSLIALSLVLLPISFLPGEILEIDTFGDLPSFVEQETLLILDIDDTLLIPNQMLGGDEWFLHRFKQHQQDLGDDANALEKALAEWEAIRHLTAMHPVESSSIDIVAGLQQRGVSVMCLTTQGLALATRTWQQLHQHAIDPSLTAPKGGNDCFFTLNGHGILYRNGILFTSGRHKGAALFKLCDALGYLPEKIVFINDKYSHLKEIEESAKEQGVPFLGLRYAFADRHKAAFRADIADIQFRFSTFAHILSDEEAVHLAM